MTLAYTFLSHPVVYATSIFEALTVLTLLGLLGNAVHTAVQRWRLHECHIRGCHRVQWKVVPGTDHVVCRHHHPHDEPTHAEVLAEHEASGL